MRGIGSGQRVGAHAQDLGEFASVLEVAGSGDVTVRTHQVPRWTARTICHVELPILIGDDGRHGRDIVGGVTRRQHDAQLDGDCMGLSQCLLHERACFRGTVGEEQSDKVCAEPLAQPSPATRKSHCSASTSSGTTPTAW